MEILDSELDLYFLQHHGVKGQEWGVKNGPPYPLERKTRAQKKAERQAAREAKKKKKKRQQALTKARATRKKNEEAKKKAAEEAAKQQARKEKLLKGSPAKVYKNRNMFTKEEIDDVLKRLDWEEKLHNYSATRAANTAKKAGEIIKLMNSAVGGYNTVAGVYNAWFPDSTPLPPIFLSPKDQKEAIDKRNKKDEKKK